MNTLTKNINLDKFGISASLLCAIHCALMPLLLPMAAVIGLGFLWEPAFEISMILLALMVGGYSITNGYRRVHRTFYPYIFLISGVTLIIASKLFVAESLEPVMLPIGALLIVAAHWFNWRLYKQHVNNFEAESCPAS